MEPDVIHLYSSSPPPLDEAGEEEEEDEFGEFGGFDGGGMSSSFCFSELNTLTTFNQSNTLEDSPPDLYIKSVQKVTVSGSGWEDERKMVGESISSVEKTEKESSDILTNGMTSSNLQMELFTENGQNSTSILSDVQNSNMGDGHSLSNGYSGSCANSEQDKALSICLQSTDTEEGSRLDVSVADVLDKNRLINQMDNLSDSNNHLSLKESEPGETETILESCSESQSFTSCGDAQEAEGEHEQMENFVVCGDAGCLDGSANCVDITETETTPSLDVDVIANIQSGDTRKNHGTSVKAELEVDEEVETPMDSTADEDIGDFRDATQGSDFSRTESITQEGFPEFVTAMSRCSTDDEFGDTDTLEDFKDDKELAEESVDDEVAFCSELPPSDSFADFSSAPSGGVVVGGDDRWAAFRPPEATEDGQDSWATFEDEQSAYMGKEEQNDETSVAPSSDNLQSSTADFSCKIQHLFRTAFPSDIRPEVSGVTEVLPLHKFLQIHDPQQQRDTSGSQESETHLGNALAMWRHLQDILGSHGLKYKWAGSHSNKILLDWLGIRNILFTGDKKQPVIVPMFAAGLGMLEPTKESQKSPASPALSPFAPVESGNILCTQVASSLAISIDAQDGGISELNLDYFGPVEECSSDSETDTPLPGVDPEIYELTTAKMENTTGRNIADAFTKLMESMEKTRTTARKPERDEKISEEAAKVISLLPDLSFMQARVLMFPSILTPAAFTYD
ncbi:aftiphilin-like isoform X2 [Carassius carassius]|uniref:aftiphilin-like isoform X2 n=1 Tax=Carassius carassius TaxID=217509 RepID=UPI00286924EC|nr:aftiphilin-like isoform X2 [Carassius carassius]